MLCLQFTKLFKWKYSVYSILFFWFLAHSHKVIYVNAVVALQFLVFLLKHFGAIFIILQNVDFWILFCKLVNVIYVKVFWFWFTVWKMSKYGVFSGPYFPVFGPEKPPYLDTFHAVAVVFEVSIFLVGNFF